MQSIKLNRLFATQTRTKLPHIFVSQLTHNIPVDNSTRPFCPRLKSKPHGLKPLNLSIIRTENGTESYPHPYEFELENFVISPQQLMKGELIEPNVLSQTPLEYIETTDQLKTLIFGLSKETEIAVDVEEYHYHSFQGLTCLVQISTRKKDYIIDAIKLRDDLHELNEIFANPKIVKVFHGADCDVLWLQRDFSVYIVNMFDTHQAAKKLNHPKQSLAGLIEYYCKITFKKSKNMHFVDWRVRPLPKDLIDYARNDTHYLLFISDCMRYDLFDQANGEPNLLQEVYMNGIRICKRTYEKPQITSAAVKKFCANHGLMFNNQQMYAFNKLFFWRDEIARNEDESRGAVLPNSEMIRIATELPTDQVSLLALCKIGSRYVKRSVEQLCKINSMALMQPLEMGSVTKKSSVTTTRNVCQIL